MHREQRKLTEKLLFDYYLISSSREEKIFSPYPFYMDKGLYDLMVSSAEILNKLVIRIIPKFLENPQEKLFCFDSFGMKELVLGLDMDLPPFFWARFDAFCREGGGIFFSEFNYDKPCAQRETLMSEINLPHSNHGRNFKDSFIKGFQSFWEDDRRGKKPRVAVLVDPGHYEEVHLAYLYMDLLGELGYECILAGGSNFEVKNEKVLVFGREIDIILRQYPTEFLDEVNSFQSILDLYKKGQIIIINDPRAIIGQAKSLFSLLWEMVEKRDSFLTPVEVETIKRTIPFTRVFKKDMIGEIRESKDSLVLKPVLGRYSEDVYIGKMLSCEEWNEALSYIEDSVGLFIVQEFCPIKRESVLRFDGAGFSGETAFGNFGIYMVNGEVSGTCVRWSSDYLSRDDTVWISPVGIREKSLCVIQCKGNDRGDIWKRINEEAAFGSGYSGGYTGIQESFSLDALMLGKEMARELESATNDLCRLFLKTTRLVQDKADIFCPVLGINDRLSKLAVQKLTDCLVFIGRLDWAVDSKGDLKLLEINSETPAGLLESLVLSKLINKNCWELAKNPNYDMGAMISECFQKIVSDYAKKKIIKNIGIVSSAYYEDWYNTTALYEHIRNLPFNFVIGEVSAVQVKKGKLYLYDTPLDAIYRYYPLDWFNSDSHYSGVLEALMEGTLSINPPSTFISQSKAFLALIWELMEQGFFNMKEKELIKKYVPKTALTPKKTGTRDFVAKKYFGREGHDIKFGISGDFMIDMSGEYVFQERIDIQSIEMNVNTVLASSKEPAYPVIGTYIIGDRFGGIYTRVGDRITDKWALYMPTYYY